MNLAIDIMRIRMYKATRAFELSGGYSAEMDREAKLVSRQLQDIRSKARDPLEKRAAQNLISAFQEKVEYFIREAQA